MAGLAIRSGYRSPTASRSSYAIPVATAAGQAQVTRWPVYEALTDDATTARLLTLAGAHPAAQVVHDAAQAAAAEQRLLPPKP